MSFDALSRWYTKDIEAALFAIIKDTIDSGEQELSNRIQSGIEHLNDMVLVSENCIPRLIPLYVIAEAPRKRKKCPKNAQNFDHYWHRILNITCMYIRVHASYNQNSEYLLGLQLSVANSTLKTTFLCAVLVFQAMFFAGSYFYFEQNLNYTAIFDHRLQNTADFDHKLHGILKIT